MSHLFFTISYSQNSRKLEITTKEASAKDLEKHMAAKAQKYRAIEEMELCRNEGDAESFTTRLSVSQLMRKLLALGYGLTMSYSSHDNTKYRYAFYNGGSERKSDSQSDIEEIIRQHMLFHGDLPINLRK